MAGMKALLARRKRKLAPAVSAHESVAPHNPAYTMRRIMKLACVLVLLLGSAAAADSGPAPRGVAWEAGPLEPLLGKAKAGGRWVLVDVFATWCGPCHEMDDKVWSRPDVARGIGAFVPLRVDGESPDGEAIAKRYHVVGFPTLLVLDSGGAEVDRLMGFVEPKDLLSTLDKLRKGRGTLADLEKRLAAAPADATLRFEVANRHALRGDARAVAELEGIGTSASLFVLGKYYWLRGQKNPAKALATLDELARRFPSSSEAGEAPYHRALALHQLGRDPEARTALDGWIAAAPKDGSRYNAYAWMCFKNKFQPERGVEIAKKGLELDGKDDSLWDTLAELQAAVGRKNEAAASAKRALALKPQDAYYAAQVRRFGATP
jgi:thiol-disulfide isomerase/thioredoxin